MLGREDTIAKYKDMIARDKTPEVTLSHRQLTQERH